jgi:hypothetical protein
MQGTVIPTGLLEWKTWGMHNRSEDDHGARVALGTHPTYTLIVMDGRIIIKWTLRKQGVRLQTGFIWLRIKSNGSLLRKQ